MNNPPDLCDHCEAPVSAGAAFCSSCGKPIKSKTTPPPLERNNLPPATTPAIPPVKKVSPPQKVKLIVPILLGVVGLGVLGLALLALGWVILSSRPTDSPPSVSSPPVEPSAVEPPVVQSPAVESPRTTGLHDPDLPKMQKLRYALLAQLEKSGLPQASRIQIVDSYLSVDFPPAANRKGKITKPEEALPILLLAYGAIKQSEIDASGVQTRLLLPTLDRLEMRVEAGILDRYVRKKMTPKDFSAAVQTEVIPWQPSGKTEEEIAQSYVDYGKFLDRKHGKKELALSYFKKAYAEDPSSVAVLQALGKSLFFLDQYQEALPYLTSALLNDDGNTDPTTLRLRGLTLFALERWVELEAPTREYISLRPEDAGGYWVLACALFDQNETKEALLQAQKAVDLDSADSSYAYTLASIQKNLKLYSDAAQNYETARRLKEAGGDGQPSEAHFIGLSFVYGQLNNMERCSSVAADGLKLYPESATLQNNYKVGYKAQLKSR